PESLMGPAEASAMTATVQSSALYSKYAVAVDRESAREQLGAKLTAGADKAAAEAQAAPAPSTPKAPKQPKAPSPRARRSQDKGVVEEVVTSTAFRQVLRTAAREIVRGAFGTGRR
ncbi:MAG: helicase HerA-like domain-containing protein, partial [Marmoricola sp.]